MSMCVLMQFVQIHLYWLHSAGEEYVHTYIYVHDENIQL